ncbi:hypothetical protein ACTXT7_015849 [Hymenolepis weldensis]
MHSGERMDRCPSDPAFLMARLEGSGFRLMEQTKLNIFKSVGYLATIRMQSGIASRSYSPAKITVYINQFANSLCMKNL